MNITDPVSSIMTQSVLTIEMDDSLFNAKQAFDKNKIRHLPVLKDGALVGILSLTDIMRLSFGDTYGEDQAGIDNVMYDMLTINEVMKAEPISVETSASIEEAARIFSENEFHALPVLADGKLAGIVTTTDIIKALLESQ